MEKVHGLTRDHSHTRPADVLIAEWDRGKPAAFDVTVTSLCPAILRESCRSSGAASTARDLQATHQRSQMSGIEMDVVIHHNRLQDEIFDICHRAHLSVSVERGHGLTRDLAHTRPADILIAGWDIGKPAALDLTITHHSALPH